MKNFKGKVVVITGAGSGIGQHLAIEFAQAGAQLALNDYKEEGLEKTISLLESNTPVFTSVFDVAQKEAMDDFCPSCYSALWQSRCSN